MPDLTLHRLQYNADGILSELLQGPTRWLVSCEHAYQQDDGAWAPKLPAGTYECVLGDHMLHSGPIRTYEITGVPGHAGILFHKGNTEEASEGCVLLGVQFGQLDGEDAVLHSADAFGDFIRWAAGRTTFTLEVME